jgi:hypothetical protein
MRHCPVLGQCREPAMLAKGCLCRRIGPGVQSNAHGMACAMQLFVNAAFDYLAEAMEKFFSYLAPSISFGLYVSAETLFLYGLYVVFFGSQHGMH